MTGITITEALSRRRTVREFNDTEIPLAALENLLWAAQGMTDAQGKRTAPSAHALYPLRLLVVAGRVDGLANGLYEVAATDLGLRSLSSSDLGPALRRCAVGHPQWVTDAACIIVFCADMATPTRAFAEQKPYGARGARYAYMEAGAAAQNLQLQATAEEIGSVWVGGFEDEATAEILGLEAPLTPLILLCAGYCAADG